MGLIAEIVLGGVRLEEILQHPHERSRPATGTDDAAPLREDDPEVRCPRVEGPPVRDREIPHVLGDDGQSFRRRQPQEVQVGEAKKVVAFGNCDDVVAPTA